MCFHCNQEVALDSCRSLSPPLTNSSPFRPLTPPPSFSHSEHLLPIIYSIFSANCENSFPGPDIQEALRDGAGPGSRLVSFALLVLTFMFPYSCALGIFLSQGPHSRWEISFSSVTVIVNHSEISLCKSNTYIFTRHLHWESGDTAGNLRFVQFGGGQFVTQRRHLRPWKASGLFLLQSLFVFAAL